MEDVPCTPNEGCRYAPNCYSDTHHLFFPRFRYKSNVERAFRMLPENKAELCRAVHDEVHATIRPPKKPNRDVMLNAIERSGMIDPREDLPPYYEIEAEMVDNHIITDEDFVKDMTNYLHDNCHEMFEQLRLFEHGS